MSYQVLLEPQAKRDVKKLTRQLFANWEQALDQLEQNPRGAHCEKMSGKDAYRIRIGSLRAIYTIADAVRIVSVAQVGDRKDIYRKR